MKDQFDVYLRDIDASRVVHERVEEILNVAEQMHPEEIEAIFISEYRDTDGARIYNGLWFISRHYVSEAHHFLSKKDIDIAKVKFIEILNIEFENFDFDEPNDNSKMRVKFSFGNRLSVDLIGTRRNCVHLKNLVFNYFKPKYS